jgi:hypothetical protein
MEDRESATIQAERAARRHAAADPQYDGTSRIFRRRILKVLGVMVGTIVMIGAVLFVLVRRDEERGRAESVRHFEAGRRQAEELAYFDKCLTAAEDQYKQSLVSMRVIALSGCEGASSVQLQLCVGMWREEILLTAASNRQAAISRCSVVYRY